MHLSYFESHHAMHRMASHTQLLAASVVLGCPLSTHTYLLLATYSLLERKSETYLLVIDPDIAVRLQTAVPPLQYKAVYRPSCQAGHISYSTGLPLTSGNAFRCVCVCV